MLCIGSSKRCCVVALAKAGQAIPVHPRTVVIAIVWHKQQQLMKYYPLFPWYNYKHPFIHSFIYTYNLQHTCAPAKCPQAYDSIVFCIICWKNNNSAFKELIIKRKRKEK